MVLARMMQRYNAYIHNMSKCFFIITCCVFCSVVTAAKNTALLTPYQASNLPLKKGDGYVLLMLDINGVSPGLVAKPLLYRKNKVVTDDGVPRTAKSQYKLNFKGLDNTLHLLALPKGVYQITEITSPSYALPYRKDTDMSPAWRFKVQENAINYIGTLFIDNQRSRNYVEINLKNRFATNHQKISEVLHTFEQRFPLVSGALRNDFFIHAL